MPGFMQIAGLPGESTDATHQGWIRIDELSGVITRSIQPGAKDQMRSRGETTLGDIRVNRQTDKSSAKLFEACAAGKLFPTVQIDLCTTIGGKQQTFISYTLKNVIVSNYALSGASDDAPKEGVSLAFSAIDWVYTVVDPDTGATKGQVPASYNPATGQGVGF